MRIIAFMFGLLVATALFLSADTQIEEGEAVVPILAVNMANEGATGTVSVRTIPGSGNVLLETSPYVRPDLQYSANQAIMAARMYTRMPARDVDFIVNYDIDSDIVGGGSAGAATAVAAVSALTGQKLRSDVALTGSIAPNGRIGQVGSVLEKAIAAEQKGYRMVIVPPGQAIVEVMETRPAFGRSQTLVSLQEYDVSAQAGIEVVSVNTLSQALDIMLEPDTR